MLAGVLLSALVKQRGRCVKWLPTSVSVDLVVKARIASSHSACELGVMQPLASQSAPLEKVVHASGAEGGSGGAGGGAGGEGGEGGHWQAHLGPR